MDEQSQFGELLSAARDYLPPSVLTTCLASMNMVSGKSRWVIAYITCKAFSFPLLSRPCSLPASSGLALALAVALVLHSAGPPSRSAGQFPAVGELAR